MGIWLMPCPRLQVCLTGPGVQTHTTKLMSTSVCVHKRARATVAPCTKYTQLRGIFTAHPRVPQFCLHV